MPLCVCVCFAAWPEWPGGSPYITSVGATQLTDQYLPGCGQPYSDGMSTGSGVPTDSELLLQCSDTRETVCSAISGGVITSGGGFSNVNMRATTVRHPSYKCVYVCVCMIVYVCMCVCVYLCYDCHFLPNPILLCCCRHPGKHKQ